MFLRPNTLHGLAVGKTGLMASRGRRSLWRDWMALLAVTVLTGLGLRDFLTVPSQNTLSHCPSAPSSGVQRSTLQAKPGPILMERMPAQPGEASLLSLLLLSARPTSPLFPLPCFPNLVSPNSYRLTFPFSKVCLTD